MKERPNLSGMRALTLYEPWASAVAYHGKDIENRGWRPPRALVGQRFAIHASKRVERDALYRVQDMLDCAIEPRPGHILCTVRLLGVVTASDSRWFVGPVGWKIGEVETFEPIPMRGKMGLWRIP